MQRDILCWKKASKFAGCAHCISFFMEITSLSCVYQFIITTATEECTNAQRVNFFFEEMEEKRKYVIDSTIKPLKLRRQKAQRCDDVDMSKYSEKNMSKDKGGKKWKNGRVNISSMHVM